MNNPPFDPAPVVVTCAWHDKSRPVVKRDGVWRQEAVPAGALQSHSICPDCEKALRDKMRSERQVAA